MEVKFCRKGIRRLLVLLIVNVLIIQYFIGINLTYNSVKSGVNLYLKQFVLSSRVVYHNKTNLDALFKEDLVLTKEHSKLRVDSSCPNMTAPNFNKASAGKWIAVGDDSKLFVFSAFYVEKNDVVIITGITIRRPQTAKCQLWYTKRGGDTQMEERPLTVEKKLPEAHGRR